MTLAIDPTSGGESVPLSRAAGTWLRSREWDRTFIIGSAVLIPIPILVFYALRAMGLGVGTCEDLVTLLVMVGVGGPHVFATYTRTFLNPSFRREDRFMFWAALGVMAIVVSAAIASAFFNLRFYGAPPIYFLLTFFFFWAGIHIIQQNSYCVACYADKRGKSTGWRPSWRQRAWGSVDYLLMLACLYPVAIFRMSMGSPADVTGQTANPEALATQIVVGVTGSQDFANDYVFRIGRVAPILPEFMRSAWFWMAVTAAFVVLAILFVIKSVRERRQGTLIRPRFQLVATMAVAGFLVPLMPNLDTSFQGLNAWHSFQYLGLLWLMNRRSQRAGKIENRFVAGISAPGRHWRFYLTALSVTLGLLGFVIFIGYLIEVFSGGQFVLFGHGTAQVDPATGAEVYRPGSLLLAYYMIAFSFLLVHYLHDGFFFFRKRYLVGNPAQS